MLFAGLSCAEVSGAKPNSIAVAKKAVVLLNTFSFTVSSPLSVIGDKRRKLRAERRDRFSGQRTLILVSVHLFSQRSLRFPIRTHSSI